MSALGSFLGGAIIGAGDAYTKLADEQRAFRIDQTKQDALSARMLNLKRAEKGMERSGVLDENGLPMTNDEFDKYGGDRSALKGPIVAAAEIQKLKEADQPSPYMRNGVVLTKGEVAELQGDFSGVVPVYTQRRTDEQADRLAAQEVSDDNYERRRRDQVADDEKRVEASEKRADKTVKNQWDLVEHKEFTTSWGDLQEDNVKNREAIRKAVMDGDYGPITGNRAKDVRIYSDAQAIDNIAVFASRIPPEWKEKALERDPNFLNLAAIPKILQTGKVGDGPKSLPIAGKPESQLKRELLDLNVDEYTINRFLDYAKAKGYMELRKGSKRNNIPSEWNFKASVSYEE